MSLKIVYGRAGSGKTTYCLNELKKRIESGNQGKIIFLVPEQYSFQAEKDLIEVLNANGILKTEVLSFQRMAYRIFNEIGGITYPHIHPAGKSMIIYRILDKLKKEINIFSKSCDKEGFVNNVSSLISEFKRYNVDPKELLNAREEISENVLNEKLYELGIIFEEFNKTLAERYRDTDDDLTIAAKKLLENPIYDGAEIWIDGFISFTPQEYKMLETLLKQAKKITLTLCIDEFDPESLTDKLDVFRESKRAYRKLVAICSENNIAMEPPVCLDLETLPRFKNSRELVHLEKNFHSYPYQVWEEQTTDITLFSSLNIFSEVEDTARAIVSLLRDKNLRFRDIAVLTGNLGGYEKIIDAVFSEYGIPFFIDRKIDINNHPLIRMILSMFDIFIDNWSYEAVFSYLKTGLTNVEIEDIDKIENYVLACGIRGSIWTREWDMSPEIIPDKKTVEAQADMLKEINEIREIIIKPLLAFRNNTRGRRTAREFCTAIYDFLISMDIPNVIEQSIKEFNDRGELALSNEYSQVWNTVMDLLNQTVEAMGDETFGLERFSKIFKIGLGEYKIGLIPLSLDQVLVGSVERSKWHRIKALYLIGVNDGLFPAMGMDEGILSDQERNSLRHIGLELADDTRTQVFNEQYLIYRSLTIAEKYLRISWPIAGSDGKSLRPSMIISRIRKIFPHVLEKSDIISSNKADEEIKFIAGKKPTFKHLVLAMRKGADGNEISPVWSKVYNWFLNDREYKKYCEKALKALNYKNMAQQIDEQKIRQLYGDPLISSVSRLEKYTSCPFSFYVQYGLGAKERRVYKLSPPDIGTFMHVVIEKFSLLVSKGNLSWREFDREWCYEKVSEIVDEMLERMKGSSILSSARYVALTQRLKRVVSRAVWVIALHIRMSSFEPIEYEAAFGNNENYPPIVIKLDSGQEVKLTGRIDRIDAFKTEQGTYLRIIDYKSGAKDFRLSDVYYGIQLQLITYMDAIWDSENKDIGENLLPGGVLYFKIDDLIIKSDRRLTEEEAEKAIMKQLKMKGLILADVKLVKAMDNNIEKHPQYY
ncbi:MAG: helicase-exonuclease AddAB subunit AddB, partial [Clostridiaceae bacterium]|nr:helicase-exonuclease AddAB subunit AddB [Clostridiaceae bacterium]